jgi:hypothetical protein
MCTGGGGGGCGSLGGVIMSALAMGRIDGGVYCAQGLLILV